MNDDSERSAKTDSHEYQVTVDQAIQVAIGLQKRLNLDHAEYIYHEVLTVHPNHPDALHFLGLLHFQRGDSSGAIQLIRQALEVSPNYVDAHNNLGNVYRETNCLKEAEACYRQSLKLAPENVSVSNNLGTALRGQGRLDEAETIFRDALKVDADFFPLHQNLANLLSQKGNVAEAVDHYFRAIELDPDPVGSQVMLSIALMTLGRKQEALTLLGSWLEEEPDNPEARHLYAACSGEGVPSRAPDDYVRMLFDRFAESFEERLNLLDYKAPELIAASVSKTIGLPKANLDVLDAGCGTGWCGGLIKPYARRLDGVDLSKEMLKKADQTGDYDRLVGAELTTHISGYKSHYDLIVSADTLCYFGDLQDVFSAVSGALRPGGRFVFTLESADTLPKMDCSDYCIKPQGRYAHKEAYVRNTAQRVHLETETISHSVLRKEMGRSVDGLIVTLAKNGSGPASQRMDASE